ncbi:ATP-binding protein [Luteimonas dalianensis]|uniref:ATP-binding protein n=1 Tax=Luteimonas dalianensis TaxID=1148196 RepID=UPI003BF2D4E3
MSALIARLKLRLAHRPDSEHSQATVRLGVISVVLCFLLWSDMAGHRPPAYEAVLLMVLMGFIVGIGLLAGILARPGVSHVRRVIGMVADYGLMAAAMSIMGGPLAWLYVIIMWVTVGNGLRYGSRYLYLAMGMAVAAFSLPLLLHPYWHANRILGIGLLVGLVAIPLYLSGLLKALTRATREALRANEAKSRFLANMSHEFRTPLNGLAGVAELLATTRLDNEQREYLATIRASTQSLLSLVEDVLDISAIEAGKLNLSNEAFDLCDVIAEVDLMLRPTAKAKGLSYESRVAPDVPGRVRGDSDHLRQVLTNLVANAVKFTPSGSVRLDVVQLEAGDQRVRLKFTVTDTGIGIPESAHSRLFNAFEQADATLKRGYGGTGLGTSIAKKLTEAMGGSIGFQSREGEGSTFWVELPFAPVVAAAGQPAAEEGLYPVADAGRNVISFGDPFLRHRARVRPLQVLIADDHAANRMVLERILQKAGHGVVSVDGGEAVLDAVAISDYDAIICDLHMPGISGLDLLGHLRTLQAGAPATPVIILSADVTPDAIASCRSAGAHAFLAKPVAVPRLLDMLADISASGGRLQPVATETLIEQARTADAGAVAEGRFDPGVLDELSSLGMGEDFVSKFVAQCMQDASDCLARIEESGEAGDWNAMRDHAHAVKGVASNVGLVRVAAHSGEIMRLPEWQLRRDWKQRLGQLEQELSLGREAAAARGSSGARGHDLGREG